MNRGVISRLFFAYQTLTLKNNETYLLDSGLV